MTTTPKTQSNGQTQASPAANSATSEDQPIVLVGLMGSGKTTIGRRLATRLGLPFIDADAEIEKAAGQSVSDIFAQHGEAAFRDGEKRVIARLLENGAQILATGGGAFMDPDTRAAIAKLGISIWLKADLDVLMKRVARRADRPLLRQGDPRSVMERLIAERYPIYAQADITVESIDEPHDTIVDTIVEKLAAFRPKHENAKHEKNAQK